MAKRMIHTSLLHSEQVGRLTREARFLYVGMIALADDEGRLKGSATYLRTQIFPYDDDLTSQKVEEWRDQIAGVGLVVLYEFEGSWYLCHPKWLQYQSLRGDRTKSSVFPSPDNQLATKWQPNGNQARQKISKLSKEAKVSKGKAGADKMPRTDNQTATVVEPHEPTPKENAQRFFEGVRSLEAREDVPWLKEFLSALATASKIQPAAVWGEVRNFTNYWTERNSTGKKQRWETERTFEVERRLGTWFRRAGFKSFATGVSKGKNIVGIDN